MTAVHNVNGTIPGVPTSTLTSGLNTEASITLSQSMDSVNTTPDDEVCNKNKYNHGIAFIYPSLYLEENDIRSLRKHPIMWG